MLLVADVGNTRVHLGLFEGDALVARQAFPGDAVASLDAQWDALTEGLGAVVPEGAILCSVNPKAKIPFAHWAFTRFGTRPLVVGETVPYPMPVRLDDPREVGPDRVVNAYAAWRRCGSGPIVVCDFGTAITLDVVSEDGAYVGGVIAPGVRTAARALADRTALLPYVDVRPVDHVIGRNTIDAMRGGLFFGLIGLVDALCTRVLEELGGKAHLVATGGDAELVRGYLRHPADLLPDLTLEGLKRIWDARP